MLAGMRTRLLSRLHPARRTTDVQRAKTQQPVDLDASEQRAFWVKSAASMWGGRERARPCPRTDPHPEHSYRYESTPAALMYWCKGRD